MTGQEIATPDDGALAPHTLGTGEPKTPSPGWREAVARIIGSLPMHDDDRGPDNEVLIDLLPSMPGEDQFGETWLYRIVDAIASLPAPGGWREIESAPRDGTKVDLWCRAPGLSAGPGRVPDCWYSIGQWWAYDDYGDDQCRSPVHNATHWMLLPEPPYSGGGRG